MKHLDLFSGIGGFALAVEAVWPEAEHIFCDNDKFCQQVIKKHWPNSVIFGDIRELTRENLWKKTAKIADCLSEPTEGGLDAMSAKKNTGESGQKKNTNEKNKLSEREQTSCGKQILKDIEAIQKNGEIRLDKKLLSDTEVSASVAENQQKSFLPLTIKTTTEGLREENTETGICMNSQKEKDSQTNINSFVSTATTQKKSIKSAPTKNNAIQTKRLDTNTNSNGCESGKEEINPTEARQQTFGNAEECDGTNPNPIGNGLQEPRSEQQTGGDRQLPEITANTESRESGEQTEREGGKDIGRGNTEIDLITGGFPCQPFSQAGKRRGRKYQRQA